MLPSQAWAQTLAGIFYGHVIPAKSAQEWRVIKCYMALYKPQVELG